MSKFLERAEQVYFDDVPRTLPWLALALFFAGLVVPFVLSAGAGGSVGAVFMQITVWFWLTAALLMALTYTLKRRSAASVPLVFVVLILALLALRGVPDAAEGIEPYGSTATGSWLVGAFELALICWVAWFTLYLWRKGKFRQE